MTQYNDPYDSVARILVTTFCVMGAALCLGLALAITLTCHPEESLGELLFWPVLALAAFCYGVYSLWSGVPTGNYRAGVEPTKPWSHGE